MKFKKPRNVLNVIHCLLSTCFTTGKVPSAWLKGVVKPIPKSSTNDPLVPLNYRGICLLPTISKMYTDMLNRRLMLFCDINDLLNDEQNGFRKDRSCGDHLYGLTSIVRNRMNKKMDTFAAFIDFRKAFDFVDRNLLLYKLLKMNITGCFYEAVKSLYKNTSCCVSVCNNMTSWFETMQGVRQGDGLSPTLFALFVNDLLSELKNTGQGIDIGNYKLCCLAYADDIVLLSNTSEGLLTLLKKLESWCNKWRLSINTSKSQIMHFRNKNKPISDVNFSLNGIDLVYCSTYKYLGIVLNEFMDHNPSIDVLVAAGGRALGATINKFRLLKNMGYETFKTLYECYVTPVIDYNAFLWGGKNFTKADVLQNRAMRYFMGVHKFAPVLAIRGDMGWKNTKFRWKLDMCRFWNRIVQMSPSRVTRKIFDWEYNLGTKNWVAEVGTMLCGLGFENEFRLKIPQSMNTLSLALNDEMSNEWSGLLQSKPKLRTYITFKNEYKAEKYLQMNLTRSERSYIAQFRCGILPLRIETGRYIGEQIEHRVCILCNRNETEDEIHFLFSCPLYKDERNLLFSKVNAEHLRDSCVSHHGQLNILKNIMCNHPRQLAKYISKAFEKRRSNIYKTDVND